MIPVSCDRWDAPYGNVLAATCRLDGERCTDLDSCRHAGTRENGKEKDKNGCKQEEGPCEFSKDFKGLQCLITSRGCEETKRVGNCLVRPAPGGMHPLLQLKGNKLVRVQPGTRVVKKKMLTDKYGE